MSEARPRTDSAASSDAEHVLGVDETLLDLPAVGGALAAVDRLQLRLGRLELPAGARVVDVVHIHRGVDQGDRAILEHLEEPRAGRELAHVCALAGMNPRRAR